MGDITKKPGDASQCPTLVQQKADRRAGEGSPGFSAANNASTTPEGVKQERQNIAEGGTLQPAGRAISLQGLQSEGHLRSAALRHCTDGGCRQQCRGAAYAPVIHRSASAAAAKASRHVTVDAAASTELPLWAAAAAARPP